MDDADRIDFTAADGATIAARRWLAAGEPRVVLVVAHGMGEHSRRYREPLAPLVARGADVWAPDHRGHGATAPAGGHGDFGAAGFAGVVDDLATLVRLASAEVPGVPVVLLGHSMGSFAAQLFVLDHAGLIDGLALSGSAALDVLALGMPANGDVMAAFNAPFAPARTGFEWLTRDETEVDKYVADPWCGFALDDASSASLFAHTPRMADADTLATIPRDLPLYLFTGLADPLAAAIDPLIDRYRAAGVDLTTDLYPDARHELLNEINRDEVVARFGAWLFAVVRRGR